jgi:hypothetical protein
MHEPVAQIGGCLKSVLNGYYLADAGLADVDAEFEEFP